MAKLKRGKKICIVPDTHTEPGVSNKRFRWLGKYWVKEQPDIIVFMGDHFDMASLSKHDDKTLDFEGRRYQEDIDSGIQAFQLVFGEIRRYNEIQIKRFGRDKAKLYKPKTYFCVGNHEHRIHRWVQHFPQFDGKISLQDTRVHEFFDTVVPFLQIVEIEGISFSHYFTSGRMDKAISGTTPALQARNMVSKLHVSCIQGHSHVWGIADDIKGDSTKITAIVAGCFFDKTKTYVTEKENKYWWSGITTLCGVKNGEWDSLYQVSLAELEHEFSEPGDDKAVPYVAKYATNSKKVLVRQ